MLEGTDLSSAYGSPLMSKGGSMFQEEEVAPMPMPIQQNNLQSSDPANMLPPSNQIMQQLNLIKEKQMQQKQYKPSQPAPQTQPPPPPPPPQQQYEPPHYDSRQFNNQFNAQFERAPARYYTPPPQQPQYVFEPSYWDKLSSKKKETGKFIQSALIILFAISLHYIIDFVLKHYLEAYDISWNRELMIRILYPLAVVFIAWNIIAFLK